jgi:DNA excision repair protein ERCC-2
VSLFPYAPRPGQEDMVRTVRDAVRGGRSAVIESGTGTGKTAVSLAGALEGVSGTHRKVIYLTRTKSQQRQVAIECRAIGRKVPVLAVAVQGRGPATCPMMAADRDLADGTPEELSKLCSALKKGDGPAGKCAYYESLGSSAVESCIAYVKRAHPDPEEFREFCEAAGICPYEAAKKMLPYADVVSAPYAFFFVPPIRNRLFQWMGVSEKECAVIVDEAHNLPQYLREAMTYRLSSRSLDLALSESEKNGNPPLSGGLTCADVIQALKEILASACAEYLKGENGAIPPDYLREELMTRLGLSSVAIMDAVADMKAVGLEIEEAKKAHRKLPRSRLSSLADFLRNWSACDGYSHAFLVSGGDNPAFEAYCLDPRDAAEPLSTCFASVSMSGTLSPLGNYIGETGLRDPVTAVFPSPFPPENLRTVYVNDVSTKFDDFNAEDSGDYARIRKYIEDILGSCNRSAAVFFPSYAVMERFTDDGLAESLGRPVYYESRGMTQSELMEQVVDFRCKAGGVLFAVTGGRVSEGLDFPGRELELAIIVGIPFARPSAKQDALVRYCSARYGDGWSAAVKVPAVRKMRQAVGRLIRSETDRGIAVVLDRRAGSLEGFEAELTDDPVRDVLAFFSGDGASRR